MSSMTEKWQALEEKWNPAYSLPLDGLLLLVILLLVLGTSGSLGYLIWSVLPR
jgi:hypothetical protein